MSTSITVQRRTRRNLGVNGAVYKTPRPGSTTKTPRRRAFLLREVRGAALHVYAHISPFDSAAQQMTSMSAALFDMFADLVHTAENGPIRLLSVDSYYIFLIYF